MQNIKTLLRDATIAAHFRQHNLGEWKSTNYPNRIMAWAQCKKCSMEVQVNTNPLPNEINIGGEAVALNCHER